MRDIDLGLLTRRPLTSQEDGRVLLQTICELAPELAPHRYGNWEPLEHSFHCGEIESALTAWRDPFLWKRSKPRSEGNAWMGKGLRHSAIYLSCRFRDIREQTLVHLLEKLSISFEVDLAYLHLTTQAEAESPIAQHALMPFRQGLTTHDLRQGLPDLPWMTVFGAVYVDLFGSGRLLSAPAYEIVELQPRLVRLKATERLEDVQHSFDEFQKVRNAVKECLDQNAFRNHDFEGLRPRVPEFSFGPK